MKKELSHTKTKMTPDKVIASLQKENLTINKKEAIMTLTFLRKIAKITVTEYLNKHGYERGKNS